MPHPTTSKFKRVSRIVTLPDYQGVGIGGRLLDWVANYYTQQGFRFRIVTSTPALIHSFNRSGQWRLDRAGRVRFDSATAQLHMKKAGSSRRLTTSWEYQTSP